MLKKMVPVVVGGCLFALGWLFGGQHALQNTANAAKDYPHIKTCCQPCSKYIARADEMTGHPRGDYIIFEFKKTVAKILWRDGSNVISVWLR